METKILYKDSFKGLILENVEDEMYYIGTGNPNSKILIVGKEGSSEKPGERELCYVKHWLPVVENNKSVCFKEFYKSALSEGHTWIKYQKLHDYIFERGSKNTEKNELNFKERFFTTEMNINRSKKTKDASKVGIQERKDTFFKSEFIQQFPIIILACGDYIQNNDKVREIDDIFGVKFDEKYPNVESPNRQAFWTHYNPDKTKLVIHTRQLSNDVSNDLLIEMANVIKGFLVKISNEE